MRSSVFSRALGLGLLLAQPAVAQVIWDLPNIVEKKPKFDNSTVKPRADAWPRLDPGAVLCKTEGDLLRLAALRRGAVGDRPNCQVVRSPTAVQVERRAGPGRTQVTVTGEQGQDGWTDAWLPDRAPPIGGKAMTIR